MYNIGKDPKEISDVWRIDHIEAKELMVLLGDIGELERELMVENDQDDIIIPEKTKDRLRALGYIE